MNRYPHTVTFQAPTEVRSAAGGVSYTYANVSGLVDLPALVIASVAEDQTDRMVLTTDLFQIIVQGDRDIALPMAALTDYGAGVFDVIRVVRPVAPMPMATIVTAERIAA